MTFKTLNTFPKHYIYVNYAPYSSRILIVTQQEKSVGVLISVIIVVNMGVVN